MFELKKVLCIIWSISLCFLVGCSTTSPSPSSGVNASVSSSPSPVTEAPVSSSPSSLESSPSPTQEVEPLPSPSSQSSFAIPSLEPLPAPLFPEDSPAALHGALHIEGRQLMDVHNEPFQLRGVSTHGIQWFGAFINENAFKHLKEDWQVNVIRLAMYTDSDSGYFQDPIGLQQLLQKGITIASKLGLYVIVDWHILSDGNPNKHIDEATAFFDAFSRLYKNYPNVLFELCNEPNGSDVDWDGEIKPYAEKILTCIRANDNQAVAIVGTPTWSQNILAAARNPLEDPNCLYALHFYASTHTVTLRTYLQSAYEKYNLPLIVSEFGTCEATGDGFINFEECNQWLELINDRNISWINWSLCNKAESSALLKPSASVTGPWAEEDLTESGAYIKALLLETNEK